MIESMKFVDQKNKFILVPYFLEFLAKHGNLEEQLVKAKMGGLLADPFFKPDSKMWTGKNEAENEEAFTKLANKMKERYESETKEYFPIMFNQSLITCCSLFDEFMISSFQSILATHPKLIAASSHRKVLRTVERGGMKEKMEKFEDVGLQFSEVFKFDSLKALVLTKYPNGSKYLEEIYVIRNDIVHRNMLPIRSYQQLSNLTDFLQYMSTSMAAVIKSKFGIENDFFTYLNVPVSLRKEM